MDNCNKRVYFSFKDEVFYLDLSSCLSPVNIKDLIIQYLNQFLNTYDIEQTNDSNMLYIQSPSCFNTEINDLDYYFLASNSSENPFIIQFHQQCKYIPSDASIESFNIIACTNQQEIKCNSDQLYNQRDQTSSQIQNWTDITRSMEHLQNTLCQVFHSIQNSLDSYHSKLAGLSSKIEYLSLHHPKTNPRTVSSYLDNNNSNLSAHTSIIQSKSSFIKLSLPKISCSSVIKPYVKSTYIYDTLVPCCPDPANIIPHKQAILDVLADFRRIQFTEEQEQDLSHKLKLVEFNNWEYSDSQLMYLVKKMFLDLDLFNHFLIPIWKFDKLMFHVFSQYNNVAFHNFKHAFMVTQMMYSLIHTGSLADQFNKLEHMILLTASICHDLNHPGFNNTYQINSRSPLAQLYNDQSPLENHHLTVCLAILQQEDCNIFLHLSEDYQKTIRSGLVKCILATDMSKHNEILNGFKSLVSNGFDWNSATHRDVLMMMLIKSSDISNEARPLDIATKWIDCLFHEFFQQSDYEKEHGLPVASFMDKSKVTKSTSQCGFIRFVIYPLFDAISYLIPELRDHLVVPVLHQLDYYSHLESVQTGRPKSRKSIIDAAAATATNSSSTASSILIQRRCSHQQPCVNQYRYKHHPMARHLETVINPQNPSSVGTPTSPNAAEHRNNNSSSGIQRKMSS